MLHCAIFLSSWDGEFWLKAWSPLSKEVYWKARGDGLGLDEGGEGIILAPIPRR